MDVMVLKCPNCGASLEIHDDTDSFVCGFCRTSLTVRRRGGTISLSRVEQQLDRMQGTLNNVEGYGAKQTSELALLRLKPEQRRIQGELAQLKPPPGRSRAIVGIVISGLALLVVLCPLLVASVSPAAIRTSSASSSSSYMFLYCWVGFTGLLTLIYLSRYLSLRRKFAENEQTREQLTEELRDVNAEVAKHQRVIEK